MVILLNDNGWQVNRLDTFTLPITLKNYTLKSGEKIVFTVREGNVHYDDLNKGSIVFQKEISSGVATQDGNGTYVPIVASKTEASQIPAGTYLWDLALVSSTSEYELISPAPFIVKEVLR